MKVCPVCNESFADELRFCDVDGTRLTRQRDVSTPQHHNKGWSLFGVALLVGALIISGISVIFLPRAHVSPPVVGSESQVSSPNKPANTETALNAATPATSDQPEVAVTEGPPPDPKKKDKSKALANSNSGDPALNPKAAAQSAEDADKSKQPSEAPAVQPLPTPKKLEPAPAVRTVSDAREADSISKPAPPSTELKKDSKNSKNTVKDSDKKKGEEKDKKKGGFFRVFKKIFGKD
jgi:hypothetical protein